MLNSAAFPQSARQRFINSLANADIGTVLHDVRGQVVEKTGYATVIVNGVSNSIEGYLKNEEQYS